MFLTPIHIPTDLPNNQEYENIYIIGWIKFVLFY